MNTNYDLSVIDRPAGRSMSSETVSAIKPSSHGFIWGAGIECSFIPHLQVDQFEWTQHDRFWKEDFRRAREEVGITALRYALPWHKIETRPGHYDWQAADERIEFARQLGIDLYLDVMHFGTPLWLRQGAGDPEFPESLERFGDALVTRYRSIIQNWCPCNEPLVLALFSGDYGFWPPHARKWKGYMPVLSRVVQATSRAIRAIRRADPHANVILCDNVENYKTRVPELENEVRRRNLRRFLVMDLLLGRVDRHHPLFNWVTAYGLAELDIEWFRTNPQRPDVLGIDYYPNSEWQLDQVGGAIHQRRSEAPAGLHGIATTYYNRYGLPMMLTETSADGQAINREIWLEQTISDCRRLREEGVPMNGYFWWPMVDQLDWDGALTHRVGKIHDVGLFNLKRESDGTLTRHPNQLLKQYAAHVAQGEASVGQLEDVFVPAIEEDQVLPIGFELQQRAEPDLRPSASPVSTAERSVDGDRSQPREWALGGNGHPNPRSADLSSASLVSETWTDGYGIVVFSHLRWGFVWQRPQQFLSRFARKHKILFIEEPIFDLPAGEDARLDFHKVMANITVACPHLEPSWNKNPGLPALLRKYAQQAIVAVNDGGEFDKPLLWYYSPMDAAWSLGQVENRGIVYDCMDELSQFTGAPASLVQNEARLMKFADVVFTGGYELGEKKHRQHDNVHTFGCGVDYEHFSKAGDPDTAIPPDIDFMHRPVLGWFGVVDERVDYQMVGEMARLRPTWSFAMVGPVVKVDPNLLPHAPNLFWLGGRDYQHLPNYCRAFDVNMMCFAINAATQFINPTKGLEYMATGKPIVSTPVRDVVRQWSDAVRLASTAEEFVAAAEDAMSAGPDDSRVRRGIELAKQNSWETTVAKMQQLITRAITGKRHSAEKIEPLGDAELKYVFQSTQGS